MDNRREQLASAVLYLVCGDRDDAFLEAALRGGVDIVQLRIKDGDDDRMAAVARRFKRACERHGALLIVNDRPQVAAEVDADGVHLGQDDAPVAQARELLAPGRLVGLSTHSRAQVDAAGAADVDYIGVGPVHETPTKPGRPAVGLELVRYAAANAQIPFFAIGGIAPANVTEVRDAGARRIAVVRALTDAADPEGAARALRAALRAGREAGVGTA
jgi:thiamine-phosphate pyrophosphorylase